MTSGFRAISREAACQINVFSSYTYTLETIIQAGVRGMAVSSVQVNVNPMLRSSRLIKNTPLYVAKSIITIFRIFIDYKPLRFFVTVGSIFFIGGLVLCFRYLYFIIVSRADGHVQSLILAAILMILGCLFGIVGLLGDVMTVNRRLLEDLQYNIRKIVNKM